MILSQTRPNDQQSTYDPFYRKFLRACLAFSMLIAPVALGVGLGIAPGGGLNLPSDPGILVAQFQAASSLQVQAFLFLNALVPYFFPLSFIGLGLVAMRRSPWLATIGMIFGLAGSLSYGVFLGPMADYATVAQLGGGAAYNVLLHDAGTWGAIHFLGGSWVIGHLIGYVLIGIALARSRAIPVWAACLFIVGIPFQMTAYGTNVSILQVICFALIFIGSIPAALVMLKSRNEQSPVSAGVSPAATS